MKTDAGHDVRRVLDEGVVISGDVQVKLLGMSVLPIKVNLLIGSTTRAESLGMSWWPRRRGANGSEAGANAYAVRTNGIGRRRSRGRTPARKRKKE